MLLVKRKKRNKSYGYKSKSKKQYTRKKRYNYQDKVERIKIVRIILVIVIILSLLIGVGIPLYGYFANQPSAKYSSVEIKQEVYTEEEKDLLITPVNRTNPLAKDYVPNLVSVENIQVNSIMQNNLEKLLEDARSDGVNLLLASGYISYEEQIKLYTDTFNSVKEQKGYTDIKAEAETVKVVSKAGESEAQTGLIVSFADGDSSTFLNSKSFFWLEAHAIEYGFVLRYPKNKQDVTSKNYNPQCYRFVGKEYAEKMKIYGLTLEEYKEYLGK